MRAKGAVAGAVLVVALSACSGTEKGVGGSAGPAPGAPGSTEATRPGAPIPLADINASELLGGDASPDVPAGQPGKVTVVVVGLVPGDRSSGFSVPIIVRNNTDMAVGRVQVTATARDAGGRTIPGNGRDANGNLATLGRSLGFVPAMMNPGEATLGFVYYSKRETIPADATFDFTVETAAPGVDADYESVTMKVTEANLAGGRVVGTATNTTGTPVKGPFQAEVFCFDASGTLAARDGDFASADRLDAGGTTPFSVDVSALPCTTFLVGVISIFQVPPITRPP